MKNQNTQSMAEMADIPSTHLLEAKFFARYTHARHPDPGTCEIISIDWESKRLSMSNGACRYFPSFAEVEIVSSNAKAQEITTCENSNPPAGQGS
jgi:hypothetical protein